MCYYYIMNENTDVEFIKWEDAFSVGFELIDNQHKGLAVMVNSLFESCKRGALIADKAYLEAVKNAMIYAQTHFSDEEKYMAMADYPELDKHKIQHDEFVLKIESYYDLYEKGKMAPIELAKFLKNWILNHIAVSDKKYAPYLAKLSPDVK